MKMKYYRVECLHYVNGKQYVIQQRRWGIWRKIRNYTEPSEAFMHLDGLNRYITMKRERDADYIVERLIELVDHVREVLKR